MVDMLVSIADNSQSPCSDLPADLKTLAKNSRNSEEMNVITLESFMVPSQNEESSIEGDSPETDEHCENPAVTFHLIEDGSQKGKEKLADSNGYTFTVKTRRRNGNNVWTSSVRNKAVWCKASLLQKEPSLQVEAIPIYIQPTWCGNSCTYNKRRQEAICSRNIYIRSRNSKQGSDMPIRISKTITHLLGSCFFYIKIIKS